MRALAVLLVLFTTSAAAVVAFNEQPVYRDLSQRLGNPKQSRPLAAEAIDGMLKFAANHLDELGKAAEADRIMKEWRTHYQFVISGALTDAGDHLPWSDWIALVYATLESEFGVDYMEWSHLRDIWVLNFTMPVVFNPHAAETWCTEQMHDHPEDNCQREYARHFVGTKYDERDPLDTAALHHGFSGVVSYWVTWAACEAVTYGGGWTLVCMPVGTLVERVIEKRIAQAASDAIWGRSNQL